MTDEFEALMGAEFEADSFAAPAGSQLEQGIIPPSVDDHMALHLLEGACQLTAMLYAQDYVGEFAAESCPDLHKCLTVGLGAFMAEAMDGEVPELGSPKDIEWIAWVRLAAGQAALGLEAFLDSKGLERITVMVHFSNHGWYPFGITAQDPQ